MEINEVYDNIKKWSSNIEQLIYLMDIKGKEYLKEYKLKDIKNIDKIFKKCERCGKYFLPNNNFKTHQKYCDIYCRNQATRTHRYEIKLDERQRPIDLLRKSIYERRYRAKRDNLDIDANSYNILLCKLTRLVKQRWQLSETEYNKKISELYREYRIIVQKGKEINIYE